MIRAASRRSALVTANSRLPSGTTGRGEPTVAGAIRNHLLGGAHRIQLPGVSLRPPEPR